MENTLRLDRIDNIEIVGLKCTKINLTYSNGLEIHLGQLTPYNHPKLKNLKHGLIRIFSDFCDWRIVTNDKKVIGPSDNEEKLSNCFKQFIEQTLIKIESENPFGDLKLTFNNLDLIEFWATSGEEDIWTIMGTENSIVANSGKLNLLDNNEKKELNIEEVKFEKMTKETSERWNLRIPEELENTYCNKCRYFSPLEGKFYFWDYGMCFNKDCKFDGQVVGVSSGCDKFVSKYED